MSTDSRSNTYETVANDSQKSPEALEREIDQQRSSIGNIVDALEQKVSPGQLVDQALGYVKANGGEFFGNLGTQVRANPVPAVLTTVGLLWLMIGDRQPSSQPSRLHSAGERAGHLTDTVREGLSGAKARVHETVSHMKDKTSHFKDQAAHLKDSVSGTFSGGSSHSSHPASSGRQLHLRSSARDLVKDQPLALAAAGIAIGALLGAVLPGSGPEKRLINQARDTLADAGHSHAAAPSSDQPNGAVPEAGHSTPSQPRTGASVGGSPGLG